MSQYHLMVAPTGARLQKADHAAVPISPSEIAATAAACRAAGATAIHVHVRAANGTHSIDPDRYRAATEAIRKASDIAVQISTEAAGVFSWDAQRTCLSEVATRDASISLREMTRAPDGFRRIHAVARARGISLQHILYAPEEVSHLLTLCDQYAVPDAERRAIFVLGRYADQTGAAPGDLAPFLSALGRNHLGWSVCAFGPQEHGCGLAALDAGGHVRIGFENATQSTDGAPYPDNAVSVAAFVAKAANAGFQPLEHVA